MVIAAFDRAGHVMYVGIGHVTRILEDIRAKEGIPFKRISDESMHWPSRQTWEGSAQAQN